MKNNELYFRNLPHYQPLGGTFFVTYNLDGSIPAEVIKKLQEDYDCKKKELIRNKSDISSFELLRKQHFLQYEKFLNSDVTKLHYLKDDQIAEIIVSSLHYWDKKSLELICFCIMSNHVHVVMRLLDQEEAFSSIYLHKVLQSIKQYSAKKANKILGKSGQFWQRESYDYQVRDREELFRIISYVLDNPIKSGLCESRDQWKWSYIKSDYNEFI